MHVLTTYPLKNVFSGKVCVCAAIIVNVCAMIVKQTGAKDKSENPLLNFGKSEFLGVIHLVCTQIFQKTNIHYYIHYYTNILPPDQGVKNVSSQYFACLLNERPICKNAIKIILHLNLKTAGQQIH